MKNKYVIGCEVNNLIYGHGYVEAAAFCKKTVALRAARNHHCENAVVYELVKVTLPKKEKL